MTHIEHFCSAKLPSSQARRLKEAYSPECVKEEFSEVCQQFIAKSSPLSTLWA